jgi:hypothetical protein
MVINDPIRRLAADILIQIAREITIEIVVIIYSRRGLAGIVRTQRRGPKISQRRLRVVGAIDDIFQLVAVGKVAAESQVSFSAWAFPSAADPVCGGVGSGSPLQVLDLLRRSVGFPLRSLTQSAKNLIWHIFAHLVVR